MNSKFAQLLLFTFILILPCTVSGQSWQQLYEKADSLYEDNREGEALPFAQKALKQAEVEFGKQHVNYGLTLKLLGSCFLGIDDINGAETNFKASKDVYLALNLTKDSAYATILNGISLVYRIQGKYPAAMQNLIDALQSVEESAGKESDLYSVMLGNLGALYTIAMDYKKAESVLLEVLSLEHKRNGDKTDTYATTLNTLGLVYLNLNDYGKSESYFQKALAVWREVLPPEHLSIQTVLGNLGFLYLQQGAYDEAIKQLRMTLLIKDNNDIVSTARITNINNLASCYYKAKQFDKADSLYRNVLAMLAEKYGKSHPDYINALNNLGTVYHARGQFEVALKLYQEAIELSGEQIEAKRETPELLSNMARANFASNKSQEANSLYRRALAITRKQIGEENLLYAEKLDAFTHLLNAENKLDSVAIVVKTVQQVIGTKESSINKVLKIVF